MWQVCVFSHDPISCYGYLYRDQLCLTLNLYSLKVADRFLFVRLISVCIPDASWLDVMSRTRCNGYANSFKMTHLLVSSSYPSFSFHISQIALPKTWLGADGQKRKKSLRRKLDSLAKEKSKDKGNVGNCAWKLPLCDVTKVLLFDFRSLRFFFCWNNISFNQISRAHCLLR